MQENHARTSSHTLHNLSKANKQTDPERPGCMHGAAMPCISGLEAMALQKLSMSSIKIRDTSVAMRSPRKYHSVQRHILVMGKNARK